MSPDKDQTQNTLTILQVLLMCSQGYKTLKVESISERKLFFFPVIFPLSSFFISFFFLIRKGGNTSQIGAKVKKQTGIEKF